MVKISLQCRRCGSIPGSGRSPGGGNGKLLQYFCLENPMNRGAWWATVPRLKRLKRLSTHTCKAISRGNWPECSRPYIWFFRMGLFITDISTIIEALKWNVCSLISIYEWWRVWAQESENLGWNPTWLPSTVKLDMLLKSSGPQLLHLLNGSSYSPYQDCCEDKRNEYMFSPWNSSWHILSPLKYHFLQEKEQRRKQANTLYPPPLPPQVFLRRRKRPKWTWVILAC